jgi:uncharacterized protein (TIGR00369 family)
VTPPASTLAGAPDLAAEGWSSRDSAGFSGLVGPIWARREEAGWAYGFVAGPQHLNAKGIVHGGMLLTLMDNALGLVVWEASGRSPAVTMQLNMQFLAAARPGDFVVARGEVLRRGRSVIFVRGVLSVGERSIGAADGIWKLLESE